MTYKEKQVEAWKKLLLLEMAITRSDFFINLSNLSDIVTEHLVLIFTQPDSVDFSHWCGEVYANFSTFPKLKYRHNKYPTAQHMKSVYIDTWFESLDDQLEFYIDLAYTKENQPMPQLSRSQLDTLRNQIKQFIDFIINNINPENGRVDKSAIYDKLSQLARKR